ncbi:MAG: hypothetical protein U5R49_11555 [Deltaproteobacteria bacterium]|nr:hypothetical protein [Deltaproteobacteria bacterium]
MTEKKKLSDIPLEIRAEEAMKKAVEKAIEDHRRTGDPIVIWKEGKVARVPVGQFEVREPGVEYKTGGSGEEQKADVGRRETECE